MNLVKEFIERKVGHPVESEDWISRHMDSMTKYELMYELEDAFNVSIPDDVGSLFNTIGEIVKYVDNYHS
jgi:acyl carrier protein